MIQTMEMSIQQVIYSSVVNVMMNEAMNMNNILECISMLLLRKIRSIKQNITWWENNQVRLIKTLYLIQDKPETYSVMKYSFMK